MRKSGNLFIRYRVLYSQPILHMNPRYFLFLTLSVFAFSNCSRKQSNLHSLREAKGDKKLGGSFFMNEVGDLRSLDPPQINDATSNHIAENIYDKVIDFDKTLKLVPSLASLPDISADGLTYTFHVRSDVWFQDDACFPGGKGRKLAAQ